MMNFFFKILAFLLSIILLSCGEPPPQSFNGVITTNLKNKQTLLFLVEKVNIGYKKTFLLFSDNNIRDGDILVKEIRMYRNEKKSFLLLNPPKVPLVLESGGKNKLKLTIEFTPQERGIAEGTLSIIISEKDGHTMNYFIRIIGQAN